MAFTRGSYKYSLLCTSNKNGILDYSILYGAVNESTFNQYIVDKMIPILNPYPAPNSIIILDNCRFHHNQIFKDLMDQLNVIIIYLPRYDPILNPTEYVFRDVKSIEIKKNIYVQNV